MTKNPYINVNQEFGHIYDWKKLGCLVENPTANYITVISRRGTGKENAMKMLEAALRKDANNQKG